MLITHIMEVPGGSVVKNLPANARVTGDVHFGPWRRPIFLPGEFYGQRSLAGDSPWDYRVEHTEQHIVHTHTHTHTHT